MSTRFLLDSTDRIELFDEINSFNIQSSSGVVNVLKDMGENELYGLLMYGKTELNKPYQLFDNSIIPASYSAGGATITNNNDGSFTISGSGKLTSTFAWGYRYSHEEMVKLLKSGDIYVNYGAKSHPFINYYIENRKDKSYINLTNNYEVAGKATVPQEALDDEEFTLMILLYGYEGADIVPATVRPMIYQDGDGTWEPFSHTRKEPLTCSGKLGNLFDASRIPTIENGGATVTNNGDGSFTISGSGTLGKYFNTYYQLSNDEFAKLIKVGNTLQLNDNVETKPLFSFGIYDRDYNNLLSLSFNSGYDLSYTLTEDIVNKAAFARFYFTGDIDTPIVPGTIKPMLYLKEQINGKYRPYSGQYEIENTIATAQLFDADRLASFSDGGATVTNNGDGSFTVSGSGKLTKNIAVEYKYSHEETINILRSGDIYAKHTTATHPYVQFYLYRPGHDVPVELAASSSTLYRHAVITDEVLEDPRTFLVIAIYGEEGVTINPGTDRMMVYQDGDGEWQPFANQNHISLVGKGFNGIPIGKEIPDIIKNTPAYMSGVYWDEEKSQYYISDTKDYENNENVQRILKETVKFTKDETSSANCTNADVYVGQMSKMMLGRTSGGLCDVCDNYAYTQNDNVHFYIADTSTTVVIYVSKGTEIAEAEVAGVLLNPITTPIAEKEMDSYNTLHTNNHYTTVSNDCDVYNQVGYLADKYDDGVMKVIRKLIDELDNKYKPRVAGYEKFIGFSNQTSLTIKATDTRQYFEIEVSYNGNTNFSKYIGVYSYSIGEHSFTKVAGEDLEFILDNTNQSFTINVGNYARVFIKSHMKFNTIVN